MSERNLSRRMATSIVDALKAQGHILVVKGGSTPLVRELDDRMSSQLETITPQIVPRAAVGGEVTSTFGNEAVDETVEQIVADLTTTLMDSDHVEDVFAEDNVIQRDIFRVVRDTLLHRDDTEADDDELPIRVRLDTLGYVASTVGKLAGAAMLREALERAADAVEATLTAYTAPTREATFLLEGGGPDRRLELEEAVADELSDLVDDGLVDLPTIERRIDLDRETTSRERVSSRARIELAAVKTIMRSGCAAAWEFSDARTIKVTFTPLSEQDANDIDPYVPAFARELAAIFPSTSGDSAAEPTKPHEAIAEPPHAPPSAAPSRPSRTSRPPKAPARASTSDAPPSRKKEPAPAAEKAPAAAAAAAKKTSKRVSAATTATATSAAKKTATAAKKTAAAAKPAAKKTAKTTAKKR